MDIPVTLPGGQVIDGDSPIVVIGPNGSGKTRQTRNITAPATIEFVNALRNTRVSPELPAMGVESARQQFTNQKAQFRGAFWELSSEFDVMLSQLLAQYSTEAINFQKLVAADVSNAINGPKLTPLKQIEELWSAVFPGRELDWRDWKPIVTSTTSGSSVEYSGNQMSDGEKAALFLAGRVFSFEGGVLVVDEPETHFHSLLAVRFWNALEEARPDIRFVYVTHDLTFALSRREPTYVLANPIEGLRAIDLGDDVPEDVAGALLGSASLSFYASRVIFCEGDDGSYDASLYNAWFRGPDTVVRPVGGCQAVMRCVEALRNSGIAQSLMSEGIVDRDYHSEAFLGSFPSGVTALPVHEVESLLALPEVVEAVSTHLGGMVDQNAYVANVVGSVDTAQVKSIVIQRWKTRLEPLMGGLVANTSKQSPTIAALALSLPAIFDVTNWSFDPAAILIEEENRVTSALAGQNEPEVFAIVPGKQLLPLAARAAGMETKAYANLIFRALRETEPALMGLASSLNGIFGRYLPPRFAQVAGVSAAAAAAAA